MMFGSMGKYAITYKTNSRYFDIYKPKYIHDFKVLVSYENFEGSKAIYIESTNTLVINQVNVLKFFDAKQY